MSKQRFFIGTYPEAGSKGIYVLELDTIKGSLAQPGLLYETTAAKALHVYDHELMSVCAMGSHAGILSLDLSVQPPLCRDQKRLESVPSCSIYQDEQFVYTANYHEGSVRIYRKEQGKLKLEEQFSYGKNAKCHQVIGMDDLIFVTCLGLDRIKIYDRANHFSLLQELLLPKHSGPRHLVIDASHRYLYVLSECSNEIFVYTIGAHASFHCIQICSLLPQGAAVPCASAQLRISNNQRFLYASTRGADIITCFEIIDGCLRQKEVFSCGGAHPRDFILDESGRYLLVCNKDSNNVVLFLLDPETGEAIEIREEQHIPAPVAIVAQEN